MSNESVTREEAERLLCAIFPTRSEKALDSAAAWCWNRNEGGVFGWIGDRFDHLRWRSNRRRAARKVRAAAPISEGDKP